MDPLPLDVLGIIFDILIDENTATSREALKYCTLVSRASVPQIQRYLFSEISVTTGSSCGRLAAILRRHPDLATYVKKLHIDLIHTVLPTRTPFFLGYTHDLITILYLLSNIHSLDLASTALSADFVRLPEQLQTALLVRFRTVVQLKWVNIIDFPMEGIASCTLLKSIEIVSPHYRGVRCVVPFNSSEFKYTPFPTCQLDHLSLDDAISFHPFLASQGSLRSLTIKRMAVMPILPLLHASQESLLRLSIETSYFDLLEPLDMDFPALRSISISQRTIGGLVVNHLSFLVFRAALFILECGSTMSPHALQEADISIMLVKPMTDITRLDWGRLDAVLVHPRYGSFKVLTINVGLLGGSLPDDNEAVRATVLKYLPLLHSASKVKVNLKILDG
ncbi:hypothetical protein DXG01_001699 [Tephrocybe rancida]|nr:hypothetical protein DXG01_001699 [Tephrocybe rancida]